MPAPERSREILCTKCLRLFSSAQSTSGRCPNCGEPLPPESPPLQPGLPGPQPPVLPKEVRKHNYVPDGVLSAVVFLVLFVVVGRLIGSRVWAALMLFLPLYIGCYVLAALMLRNSFARVLVATLMSVAIVAALVGMFFAGCALILKGFNQ